MIYYNQKGPMMLGSPHLFSDVSWLEPNFLLGLTMRHPTGNAIPNSHADTSKNGIGLGISTNQRINH